MLRSLKLKVMLMMLIVIIIPLLIVGGVSLIRFTESTEEFVYEKLQELTELNAEVITDELANAHNIANLVSFNETLQKLLEGDESKRRESFEYLQHIQSEYNDIIEMLVLTDEKGLSLMTTVDENSDIDVSTRQYFQDAISTGSGQSSVIISKATNEPIIAIAYAIEEDGKVIGTVIATVKFTNITKHVEAIQVFDSGYGFLVGKDGMFLSHPDKDNVEMIKTTYDLEIPELDVMMDELHKGNEGEAFYTYKDIYKYVKYVPIGEWGLVITANHDDYMSTTNGIRNIVVIVIVVSAVIALLIAYIFTVGSITNPLKKLSNQMNLAGEGDLTVKVNINTKDEIQAIGETFNEMVYMQHEVVRKVLSSASELSLSSEDISESTGQISLSGEEITKSIDEVAHNSSTQSESIIDTSEVLLQLSSLIQLAKSRAVGADANVINSLEVASNGRESVDNTIEAIEDINSASEKTNVLLHELEDLSAQVRGIIGTINAIADQTNLLALNASIEAARAGEHGRGFAVVADEVRKLAEQTGTESSGIRNVVENMVGKIKDAVSSMEEGTSAVKVGVEKAKLTDKAFISIQDAVNLILSDIRQIVEVTDDEVASSDKILKLIDHVATLSENNSNKSVEVASEIEEQTALLQTLAAGSEELTAMASELHSLVNNFEVKGEGNE